MKLKKNKNTTIELLDKFLVVFIAVLLSVCYAFVEPVQITETINVKRQKVADELNLGVFNMMLLKALGGAQNGPIEPCVVSRADFIFKLSKPKDWKITLIPGETIEVFFKTISNEYNLSNEKLKEAYYLKTDIPDGVIRPDTYFVRQDSNESSIIDRLFTFSNKENKKLSMQYLGDYNANDWFLHVITKASIIQKEAISAQEMPLISSVIDNRLKIGMPLQMDGSLNYGIYSHQKITPDRIRHDMSFYNTYKYKGLPKYPVCSVSSEAIKAAVFPAKTDYLYFVRGSSGVHVFSKDYKSHMQIINTSKNR